MVNIPAAVFVFGPLTSMRDMSSLQYSSVLSLIAMSYTSMVLLAECPYYYKENVGTATINAFIIDWNFFTSCSLTFFSYTCQVQILPIYSELVNPQYRRIKKVVVRSIFVDFLFYAVFAVCGYLATFNYTNSITIERADLPNYSPDYTMLVAAASISLVVFGALPLNANPCRNQFFLLFFKNTNYS
jgi:amino acid permease